MNEVRIKICCISSIEEARLAIDYGADALGLVGKMPSGPGVISDERIHSIAYHTPPPIATFLLTSEIQAQNIITHYHKTHTTAIQIVDQLQDRDYSLLRQKLPQVKWVQVIHVIDEGSLEEAIEVAPMVDALLLDSGNPRSAIKELGGTGRTHDWKLSRKIREQVKVPVLLAGGLNHNNVREAIEIVRPFGVDICSGVRTEGKLDEKKLYQFMKTVRSYRLC